MSRDLILKKGLAAKVKGLLTAGIAEPKKIAEVLNDDPEVKEKLGGNKVLVRDVRDHLDALARKGLTAQNLKKTDESALVVAQTHERLANMNALFGRMENIMARYLDAIDRQMEVEDGPIEQSTHEAVDRIHKHIKITLDLVKHVKTDTMIQRFLEQGSMRSEDSMSEAEVHRLCFALGEELGASRDEVLRAFARARAKCQSGVIDVRPV